MIEINTNIARNNALPYVEIKNPKLKLLIDTGSSRSILRPCIAEEFFPDCIYQTTNIIKTAVGSQAAQYQADINFSDFKNNHEIKFILFDFHDYYDGVLGLSDLIKMNLNIDLKNKKLIGQNIEIPFKYREPKETSFSFSVNSHEKIIKKIPVSVFNGDIITISGTINDLYIPQILSYAKEGFAPIEIQNLTNKTICVTLNEPIPVNSFQANLYETYTVENFKSSQPNYPNKNNAYIKDKKGKYNQAADALSRIPPSTDLNALETSSICNNPGDIDETIEELIRHEENLPDISELEIEDFLKPKPKINIISNILIRPADKPKQKDSEDLETVHTAEEDPIFGIPISERSLNTYKHQIIMTSGDIENLQCKFEKVFDNTRVYVTISKRNSKENIIKLLKEFIDIKQTYALYFRDPILARNFTITLQELFKNSSYKFIQCSKFLTDVETLNDQKEKLNLYHTTKTCHRGINEMKQSLTSKYYWPKMSEHIEHYINNCEVCQKNKYDRNPPVIKFNLTPTTSKPFEHIHIDTFKISNENYLTIIDTFSRYGQAYPLKYLTGPAVLENIFSFITHHGIPNKITTDCGTEFKNKEVEDFCKIHKIELHYTTSKNSNSNSPVERFHSTLIEHYRCLKESNTQFTPDQLIKRAILGYNNSIHSVTKHTPFEIIKGHIDSIDPFDLNDQLIVSNYVSKHKENVKELYHNIQRVNAETKEKIITKRNDKRSEPQKYNTGTAYVKTKARSKDQPRYKKTEIKDETDIKLITDKGTYHKNLFRKPKTKQNLKFQEKNDKDPPDKDPNPSTSSTPCI